ncbi:hypothetical protein HZC30_00540 [Candidatus Woesearchaeota archaeon]|nr:hypothetical protein [Candidatus Woesearchaeota archaeon]
MIQSKKAMMDDLFDFLFLVIVMMFIMFYFQVSVIGAIDKKNEQSLVLADRNGKVDDYLIQNRIDLEHNKTIETEMLNTKVKEIYAGKDNLPLLPDSALRS